MLTVKRAFKNILRRRYRTLLVSLILALCVAVFASAIAGVDASEAATAKMLADYEQSAETTIEETELSMTSIQVGGMGGGMGSFTMEELDEGMVDDISAMDGVAAVVPTVSGGLGEAEEGSWGGDRGGGEGGGMFAIRGMGFAYMVSGVLLDDELNKEYHYIPTTVSEGRSLAEGDDNAVMIGEALTDYFGAGVGETVAIEGRYFDVVGIYSSGFMDRQVYMSLPVAQGLLDMEGQLSSLTIYAESVSDVDAVVTAIEEAYPGLMVTSVSEMQSRFGDRILQEQERIVGTTDENLSSIQSMGLNITVISIIIGVLLIFGLMFYTVRERTKEIGTLKALGFSNGNIMRQFMFEGMYIGIIGGVIGLAIAAAASSIFSSWLLNTSETLRTSVSVAITAEALIWGFGVAIIAGAIGSLYPAWRASRVSPMEALRND
jgi:putative ABC transport system permease protein